MDNFIYYTPTKVYFGKGEEYNVGKYIKEYNPHKVLLHFGSKSAVESGLIGIVEKALKNEGIPFVSLGGVRPNPELPLCKEGIELCIKEGVDFILAVGGGSVLDSAKEIANGVANPDDDTWDYHLGKKKPLKTLKKGCILTLAAAGSEMSNSAVISNPETHEKRGFNSDLNRFDFAICNPELTYTVSQYQTACGAVDIAMHSIERYFTKCDEDTEFTDDIALTIIKDSFKYGKLSYLNPTDYHARSNMMWASTLSHNGLTNSGKELLLTVHQLEHELSAMYPSIAHGAGLAALWCSWARFVYRSAIDKWYKYAEVVWDEHNQDKEKAILSAIDKQEKYYHSIGMPVGLKELGVKQKDLEELAFKTSRSKSRIIPGYQPLGYEEVLCIFKMAYQRD